MVWYKFYFSVNYYYVNSYKEFWPCQVLCIAQKYLYHLLSLYFYIAPQPCLKSNREKITYVFTSSSIVTCETVTSPPRILVNYNTNAAVFALIFNAFLCCCCIRQTCCCIRQTCCCCQVFLKKKSNTVNILMLEK